MEFPKPLLCLLPPPADWKGPSEIFAELSGYPYYKKIEAVGAAYQKWLKRRLGEADEEVQKTKESDAGVSKDDEARFARHKKVHVHMDDPYELMGLDDLRWRATEDDIKSAFRKLVLLYHPDKMPSKTEADDELFKKISKANDTLIDPKKRRALDSQDQFDDSIPSANIKGEFYATFNPVFLNFSRWSMTQPCPLLGDADTPFEQVQKFYDFWYSFKSWRDHSYMDEYKLDDAESREERRWMEKQNAGERKKLKKEEMSTIFRLTENAEKQDPRVKKRKEELANEKQRAKDEKHAEKRKYQEEIARKAQEEKDAKEREEKAKAEEAERLRVIRIAEKGAHTQERNKLRKFSTGGDLTWHPINAELELLVARLSLIQITELNQSIERNDGSAEPLWKTQVEEMKKQKAPEPYVSPVPVKNKAWSDQEIALLSQALAKIPGGSTERWERISTFVGTRTMKECIAKSKEGKAVPTKPSQLYAADDAFERFNKQKKKSDVEVKSEASLRDDVAIKANADAVAAAKEAANGNATLEKAIEWTPEEQKLLEKALQTYTAALTDRWDKVAIAVGKSKKECILRYKYLVAQIKAKSGK